MSRRNARMVCSLIWVVGGNCLQGGEGPVHRRRVRGYRGGSMWFPQERRERFQKQQRDKSGGETARDYPADTSMIHFQIFYSVSQRKGSHPGEAYERTGRMKALYSWEWNYLEGPTNERLAASTWWCGPRAFYEGWAEMAKQLPWGGSTIRLPPIVLLTASPRLLCIF